MALKKPVRIVKKIRPKAGQWKFISMPEHRQSLRLEQAARLFFCRVVDRSEALQGTCWADAERGD